MKIMNTLWVSKPFTVVPASHIEEANEQVDPNYERLFRLYQVPEKPLSDRYLFVPQAQAMSSEALASTAITGLIREAHRNPPDILIDCRSSAPTDAVSPTYRLASQVGFRKVLPFSVMGQAGAEVGQALKFLQNINYNMSSDAIISATQRLSKSDKRSDETNGTLADGAAAIYVSKKEQKLQTGFRLLGLALGQGSDFKATLVTALNQALNESGVTNTQISWTVAHNAINRHMADVLTKCLPNAIHLRRTQHHDINFGCADLLISIDELIGHSSIAFAGIGTVFFFGRFGACHVGVLERIC